MYVTGRLSEYRRDPSKLSTPPPIAPNSGYMVIMDTALETEETCCWGLCDSNEVKKLPFPQNKTLFVSHSDHPIYELLFTPVLDEPLSSNRYYVIHAKGRSKGQACMCATEEDKIKSIFGDYVRYVKPKAFDPTNVYQQVEICNVPSSGFYANSVLPNCYPPSFLREKCWTAAHSTPSNYLNEEIYVLQHDFRAILGRNLLPGESWR